MKQWMMKQWSDLMAPLALLTLVACPGPGPTPTNRFSLTFDPVKPVAAQGGNVNITVQITRTNGFTQPVTLLLEGAPSGVTGTFDPNPAPGDASNLRLEVPKSLATRQYTITVKGTAGDDSHTASTELSVSGPVPASTATVDTTIKPTIPQLKPLADGQPRPVVALMDAKGHQMDFVENEIVLLSDNPGEVNAFITRWKGSLLKTIAPPTGSAGEVKTIYHIRMNPDAADTSALPADLQELDPARRGDLRLSSQGALKLLAATVHEKVGGVQAGLNMVFQGQQTPFFEDLNIQEGALKANSNPIGQDSRNATAWPYMASGTVQNINVADAWRALERAGKLGNTVKVAVIDGGFFPPNSNNPDPTQSDWPRFVADADEINNVNEVNCGSNPCPRHGSDVSMALAGRAGNNRGPAGPGAPVTQLLLLEQYGDGVSALASIVEAVNEGARIINMSFGAPIPAVGALADTVSSAVTTIAFASDAVLFASAGNNGQDVDAEDCFGAICWEEEAWVPCESAGVICVGGLQDNSNSRATNSNFGSKDVDIFGPFCVYVGETELREVKCGTSFSSPFVAGVAALMRAANPSLSSAQVVDILLSTAHTTGSPPRRVVNAFGAVQEALGGNVPPFLAITKPDPTGFGDDRNTFDFEAVVKDFEPGCCTFFWTSNLDGTMSTNRTVTRTLSNGQHIITINAKDDGDITVSRSITLNVNNRLPEVTLTPPNLNAFYLNGSYTFTAQATDFGVSLPCSSISWSSSAAADGVSGTGCSQTITLKSLGNRTITVTATDQEGSKATASSQINAINPPPSGPPQVQITSPDQGARIPYSTDEIRLAYRVTSDPGCSGTCNYNVVWKFRQGSAEKLVSPKTGVQAGFIYFYFRWEDYFPLPGCGQPDREGNLTLEVTDPEGLTGKHTVTIYQPGCPG
jgi:hypothetical protein